MHAFLSGSFFFFCKSSHFLVGTSKHTPYDAVQPFQIIQPIRHHRCLVTDTVLNLPKRGVEIIHPIHLHATENTAKKKVSTKRDVTKYVNP